MKIIHRESIISWLVDQLNPEKAARSASTYVTWHVYSMRHTALRPRPGEEDKVVK